MCCDVDRQLFGFCHELDDMKEESLCCSGFVCAACGDVDFGWLVVRA